MEYLYLAIIVFLSTGLWSLIWGFMLPRLFAKIHNQEWRRRDERKRRLDLVRRGDTWELARRLKNTEYNTKPNLRDYFELHLVRFAAWINQQKRKHLREIDNG